MHDDVIKWKHFPRYWPFVRGINRSPVNSPHKGQWRGALMPSLICAWMNGWVNNSKARDLRRHRAHHDATVMAFTKTHLPVHNRAITSAGRYITVMILHHGLFITARSTEQCGIINHQQLNYLSSTLPEIDPDTAYVVCISVSLGFRQKPSDTALLSVIALTTFNCIVSASVTKGVLVCFVVTVHWWRHRTHYDVTEAYRVLRNILTVDLNNGATRADLRGIPKHYEATAKAGR